MKTNNYYNNLNFKFDLDDWYSDIEDMIIAHFQYWNLKSICFTKHMMYIILYDRHDKLFSH